MAQKKKNQKGRLSAIRSSELLSADFIEKAARKMWETGLNDHISWNKLFEEEKNEWREMAKAVILLTLKKQNR